VNPILVLALALILGVVGCGSKPQSSGTNTNWLRACTNTPECGGEGTCRCGLCTDECAADSDCPSGICGSALESNGQCATPSSPRICLPELVDASSCTELAVPAVAELSAAAAPACDVPGALLCESFDAPLPPEYATWYSGAVAASIEDCRVHRGAGALRYQSDAFGYVQTRMRLSAPVSSGPLYARFYAYVPSSVTIPDYLAMFELWCEDASSEGKISVEAIPDDVFELYLTPNGTAHAASAGSLVRDQWICIELALEVAPQGGSASLSVDGTVIIEQTDVVTLPASPISVAVIEALPSEDAAGVDLTIDDLVVASQPIGCR
jgi:hypothetical protein